MSVQKEQALSQAFELIEADKLEEARAILKPILDTDKDNPDVWWLYAHAVTDPETARLALNNVRRLNPDYLNADDLLYSLDKQFSDFDDSSAEKDPSFLPSLPSTLPGLPGSKAKNDEDDWDLPDDEDDEDDEQTPIFRRPIFLLALGTIIFALIAAFVILQPQSQPQTNDITATSTSIAEVPTVESFQAVDATATQDQLITPETDNSVPGVFDNLYIALSSFSVADNGITTEQTTLGNTLTVSVCTEPGVALREALPDVLKAVARESSSFDGQIQAVSARMIDCTNNVILLMLGVPVSDAQAYAAGSASDIEFQSKWQPVS